MLPKSHRLPSPDISLVMKTGKRVSADGFAFIYHFGKDSGGHTPAHEDQASALTRFAFIVSKKTDKRATVRNRIKRILSESVRHLLPSLSVMIDGVFIGNKGLAGLTQVEVEIKLREVLKQLKCLD